MFLHQHRRQYLANYNQIFAVFRIGLGLWIRNGMVNLTNLCVSQIEQITTQMSKLMANMGKLSGEKTVLGIEVHHLLATGPVVLALVVVR